MSRGLLGGLPDNYRKGNAKKNCGNCEYLIPRTQLVGFGACTMWRDLVAGGMVCNKWEKGK